MITVTKISFHWALLYEWVAYYLKWNSLYAIIIILF